MFAVSALVFTFSSFIFCNAAFVDTLPRCSIKDEKCLEGMYQHIMKTPEQYGVTSLDPFKTIFGPVTIMKDVTLNITESTAKGMSNCVFNKFKIELEKGRVLLNVTCDAITLKSQFVISGENSELQSIIGSNTLNGQGRAKIKLENFNVNIEASIYVTKKDGDIYFQISKKNVKYTYNIGNAHFVTEKVMIANNDFSELLNSYLNNDPRTTIKQYGSIFMDRAMELIVDVVIIILDKIPANKYIIEDLNSYLEE